jgi:hypothetical protein
MTKMSRQKLAFFRRAEFLSARDLGQRAAAVTGLFLLAHLAGLREFTSVLNGTVGSTSVDARLGAFLAAVYVLLYLAFVILVPILILAALLLAAWQRYAWKEESEPTAADRKP